MNPHQLINTPLATCNHETAVTLQAHGNTAVYRCTYGCDKIFAMEQDGYGVWHKSDLLYFWYKRGWHFENGIFRQQERPYGHMSLADAIQQMAHCSEETRAAWVVELAKFGIVVDRFSEEHDHQK